MKKVRNEIIGFVFLISVSFLSIQFHTANAYVDLFTPPVNLSNNVGLSFNPSISASGTNTYIVWSDDTSGNNEIMFKKSTDSGASFGLPINLSNNVGNSASPFIFASGTKVYVVWSDNTTGNNEIMFSKSTNSGGSFSAPVNLSNSAGFSISPSLSASSTKVYVSWQDDTSGNNEIMFSKSTNSGGSFSAPVNLSNTVTDSTSPSISVSGSSVYLSWSDNILGNNEIQFSKSTNSGVSFSGPINFSNNLGGSLDPAIFAFGNTIVLAWVDTSYQGNEEIFFSKSTDSGVSFSFPVNISDDNWYISSSPSIFASGKSAYVTWTNHIPVNNPETMFLKATFIK